MFTSLTYYLTLLWVSLQSSINLEEGNRLRYELSVALNKSDYQKALIIYDSLHVGRFRLSPTVRLQVAHAAIEEKDTTKVQEICAYVLRSNNPNLLVVAYNQLGVMKVNQKKYRESLTYFKKAIEAKPTYELAIYNYELISKKYPPSASQSQSSEETNEEQQQEGVLPPEQTEQKEDILQHQSLPQMGRERALQLLDAMRSNEGQGFAIKRKVNRAEGEKDW